MGKIARTKALRKAIRDLIRTVKIDNGDVILVKANSDYHAGMNEIARALGATGRPDCIIIPVDNMEGILVANEAQMNEKGWYRKDES